MKKRPKKKKKKNKASVKTVLLIIFLTILLIGILIFFLTSKQFDLVEVKVNGNFKVSKEEVLKESKFQLNKNIFVQSIPFAKRNLEKNIRISEARIERQFPNKINIEIKERKELYQVSRPEGYYILDTQGFILKKENTKQNLVLLFGIDGELKENERIDKENFVKIEETNKIYDMAISLNFDTSITGINLTEYDTRKIVIEFEEEKKKAYLKSTQDIRKSMLMIKEILKREKGKEGEIFIRENNYTFFREKVK